MTTQISEMTASWHDGAEIDVFAEMTVMASRTVMATMFSDVPNARLLRQAHDDLATVLANLYRRMLTPPLLDRLPTHGNRRYHRALTDLRHIISDIVAHHRRDAADHGDLLPALLFEHTPIGYLPREAAPWGPRRGAPLANTRILLRRAARERLAARLARMPAERLEDGAYWQMFDGTEWTRLLGESPLTPEQSNARIRRAEQLAAEAPDRDTFLGVVPFDEEFYLTGRPTVAFTLTGDTDPIITTGSWCPCTACRSTVRFERWSGTGLEESGTVHAAQRCRRLVHID